MTKNVLCVRPEVSVQELTLLLFECGFSGVPVVDAKGKGLGVVSKTDLLRENYDRAELEVEEGASYPRGAGASSLPNRSRSLPAHTPRGNVAEIMTRTVLSLPEWASIQEAAALMALEGVRRIPIVDEDDRVVGIVCASDVLSWLAREAGYVIPSKLSPKWRTS
ncbi:MAG TPA: CBS domain-containing protein [Myxococcaceae bacterium]|nr:CBS domain-containing protein [Myxococcaceae bacterium]